MKVKSINSVPLELTFDQQQALVLFSKWLEDTNSSIPFVLSGFAGSGKTFLSTRFLQMVEDSGLCWTVAAPTHKAVGVLRQSLVSENLWPTWHPSTIHRLLRLKLKRKGDLEVCEKTDLTPNSLENLQLVLVDEASMIDSTLLEIALECAQPFSTRLVFVGDPAQLPPVDEDASPIFSMRRAITFELKKVVRHAGPVLKLASAVRDGSFACTSPPSEVVVNNLDGVVGSLEKNNWLKKAQEALSLSAKNDNPDEARILCYTNRCLEGLVPIARRAIHGEMADQLPVLPGEVLITRKAVMAGASREEGEVGEAPDMVLGSNREMVVLDVTPEKFNLAEIGLALHDNWTPPCIDTLQLEVRSGELELSLRLLPSIGTEGRAILDATLNRLKNQAKEVGKSEGRVFWRQFFQVRDAFASLGPAAVLTVHRSQGSSFDNVFVASDVFWPKDLTLRKQLLYVAVSRARKSVWLWGTYQDSARNNSWEEQLL
ncbi:ATP-dependent DNA helicase [Prochlorococcus sp. MIT 1300]|uniref:ATP-dependent DNA helicase n=1 Tax=Prochlorococcus sp. MIT 1300 TaxID=3096218 RepID=UPI002A755FE0|nr:AAA family ATPase [Prochlorococcus sp. MIT 1300]